MKEYTENVSLPIVNKTELEELVNQKIKVVAMGFSRRHPRYPDMLKAYHDLARHFSTEAVFVIYDHHPAKNEAERLGMRIPIVFYYEDGELKTAYPYLDNEVGFTKLLELIFHPENSQIALNVSELYKLLGDLNYAILAPTPELFENGIKLHHNISSGLAEIDVIRVAPNVLTELGLDSELPALFRKEDSCIVSFKSLHDDFVDDIYSFYNASKPVYKIYQGGDFVNEEFQMFMFTSPVLTDEMKDFLYEIAPRFPEYNFGWLKPEFLQLGEPVLGDNFQNRTDMHFCNFARRWFVNLEDVFTWEFIKLPFNKKEWTHVTERAIKVIKSGRKKNFVSEPVPKPVKGSLIKKIVGSTYKNFIMDPEHDVLMYYVIGKCEQCQKFKPALINFVKEFNATGKTFLKFGWINVEKNSAEEKFPYIYGYPHFELFPAKNKSAHEQLRGPRSRDHLVRFLQNRCKEPFPLTAPPPDKTQTAMQLVTTLMNIPPRMPEDEMAKMMAYLAETAESIGIDVSSVPGMEQYANKLPSAVQEAHEEAKINLAEEAEQLHKEANEKIKITEDMSPNNDSSSSNESNNDQLNENKDHAEL
ncbi:hypothetical protein TRFO_36360 [Tritrichomonas foetus]|uniref:protein disulfide-isomerase n=1 Tax=Tritrichomonas foetus TaxID=1144522 RepID=A0A1J4JDY2_9EUKA|nr:hypothetical protein TRFO_36360 [Tritrichomonas foetus]|eukprot:OHS97406.1 hypothetical protein TRFO_36360 [Tritrichomonas foetus]